MDANTLGALCALGSAATWAITSTIVRSLTPPFTSVGINAVRTTLSGAAVLLGAAAWDADALGSVGVRAFLLLAVSIVAGAALGDSVFFESVRALGLGRAMTVAMSYPVIAAVLAATVLDEPVTPAIAVGTLLTLGGLALIVMSRAEDGPRRSWLGFAAAAVAAIGWAISVVVVRVPLREVDPWIAQGIRLPLAAAVMWATPWARGTVTTWRQAPAGLRQRVVVVSVLTALSSVMFVAAIKYAGVAVGAVLSSTAPLFAIVLGRVVFGERLSVPVLAGSALTVLGVVVLRS